MSEEAAMKRVLGRRHKTKKKPRPMPELKSMTKIDRKLIRKRARNYNSDEDNENDFKEESDDIEPEGITKFVEGCRAFRLAFKSIMNKAHHGDHLLGPVMSAQKKLMAAKLAEEQALTNVSRQKTKEKRLIGEKGHVKPDTFLNSHDKFLIGVATKGVVKLFNAVNKAQEAQKGLNPLRSKDEKAIKKRRKEAFFSELRKTKSAAANKETVVEAHSSSQAAWAPLRDNYMLTTSKFKDWDKMPPEQERAVTYDDDDFGRGMLHNDSSSDEDGG